MTPVVTSEKSIQEQARDIEILYFLSHPVQYISPFLKELAKTTKLEVYYYSDISIKGGFDKGFGKSVSWDIPLLEGYAYSFLKNRRKNHGVNNKFLDVWNPSVWKVVRKSKARFILVNDWTYSSTWLMLIAARLTGKKVWVRADNPVSHELIKSKKLITLKKLVLKNVLFKWFIDKCMYTGVQSKGFFSFYGVGPKNLVFTPHAVNNEYFQANHEKNKDRLNDIKQKLGIPVENKVILFVGKYIPEKRPFDLLQAFKNLSKEKYSLLMVGEGGMRVEMENWVSEHNLKNVLLTGFINQSELPLYYSIANVFVLCSGSETWGLAVNEAMNFSLPIIVSDACGCSVDLVKQGENGFVYETANVEQLTTCINKTLQDSTFNESAGKKSLELVNEYSFESIIKNIKSALVS